MKPPSILTALRTGAYLHHLQLLSEVPARLADFYGSAMDMTVIRLGSMSSGLEPQPKDSNPPPHRVLCSRTKRFRFVIRMATWSSSALRRS
jgi:hypothetical protein